MGRSFFGRRVVAFPCAVLLAIVITLIAGRTYWAQAYPYAGSGFEDRMWLTFAIALSVCVVGATYLTEVPKTSKKLPILDKGNTVNEIQIDKSKRDQTPSPSNASYRSRIQNGADPYLALEIQEGQSLQIGGIGYPEIQFSPSINSQRFVISPGSERKEFREQIVRRGVFSDYTEREAVLKMQELRGVGRIRIKAPNGIAQMGVNSYANIVKDFQFHPREMKKNEIIDVHEFTKCFVVPGEIIISWANSICRLRCTSDHSVFWTAGKRGLESHNLKPGERIPAREWLWKEPSVEHSRISLKQGYDWILIGPGRVWYATGIEDI